MTYPEIVILGFSSFLADFSEQQQNVIVKKSNSSLKRQS